MKVKTYRGKSLQEIIDVLNSEYENSYAILSINQKLKWRFFLFPRREVEVVVGIEEKIVKKDKKGHLFLMAEQPYKSMFNQMYILRNFDKKYFELVYDDFPTMVLYKVRNE